MTKKDIIKYLVISMILLSVAFFYGAYAAGITAFITIFIKEPRNILDLILREKSIMLMAAALLLSTVLSKVIGYSILMDGILISHLMVYLVILKRINEENIEDVFKLLNLMGILICLYGIYQFFTGDMVIYKSWTDQNTFGNLMRVYSTMRNPNIFATYLTFNICHAGAYFIKKKGDIYTAINIMLSSLCLILTYSRGGFIAFIGAIVVIAIACKEIKAWVYLGFMVLLYYGYNFLEDTNRANLDLIILDSSSLYRIEIWKASWNLFKDNIFFGNGLGSVSRLLSYSSDKLKGYIFHAHSIPLHLLVETGVFGLLAFCTIILSGVRKFTHFWKEYKHSESSYVAVSFIAALTAMVIHGMVDCTVFIPSRSLIFLIYLSLFPALYLKVHNKPN